MKDAFDDFLGEFNKSLEALRGQDKPQASSLLTREVLRKLAVLPPEHYQRFKENLAIDLFFAGVKPQGMPSEARLDKMVAAVRSQIERDACQKPCRLGDMLLDAPNPDFLVPGCWFVNDDGIFNSSGDGAESIHICDSPLYIGLRIRDMERNDDTLALEIKVDAEWRRAHVAASANSSAVCKVVAGAGAIVFDHKALYSFILGLRMVNKDLIPLEVEDSFETVYERWVDYVTSHESSFMNGKWGRVAIIKGNKYLIVLPEKVEQFAKKQGSRLRTILAAWKKNGLIFSEDSLLYSTKMGGRQKRMVAFPLEALGIDLAVFTTERDTGVKEKQDVA